MDTHKRLVDGIQGSQLNGNHDEIFVTSSYLKHDSATIHHKQSSPKSMDIFGLNMWQKNFGNFWDTLLNQRTERTEAPKKNM